MRLATKSTLATVGAFVVLLGGLTLWTRRELLSLAAGVTQSTARLLGSEIAAAISGAAVEQLVQADSEARQRLDQIITDLAQHSDVVASVSVVDASGKVMASNELEQGRQLPPTDVIFQDGQRVRVVTDETAPNGGKYHLFVPLMRAGDVIGYLRLSLGSTRIEQIYRYTRRQIVLLGVGGMLFIAALGILLEIQRSRFAHTLTRTLDAVISGEEVAARPDRDEFAQALEAARRVGKELTVARAQSVDAQRRFGGLMKVMDVGIVLVGAEHTLDFANDTARALVGCAAPGELEACWEPRIRPLLQTAAATLPATGGKLDLDVPSQGRTHALRLELYPRDDRAGWLILVKNREMLDALERELRLAIQMRAFAQFYLAFAHDLKAPLNAMVLNLELLKTTLSDPARTDDDETRTRQQRYIQTVTEEVARLDRYLHTVLTHAAPPSEVRNQFDVRELVEELGTLVSPQAKRQNVALTIETAEHPLLITGHRDRLKQALLNIAINGLESMSSHGRMSVTVAKRDEHASISIQDSGPGIPPELLGEIYRIHFTTKDGGTGIGLHVARSVVQSYGGEIHVESEPGRGTCFNVELPLDRQ